MTPTMMFFSFALSSSTNSDSVALLSENAKSFLCLKLTLSTNYVLGHYVLIKNTFR